MKGTLFSVRKMNVIYILFYVYTICCGFKRYFGGKEACKQFYKTLDMCVCVRERDRLGGVSGNGKHTNVCVCVREIG